MSLNWRGLFHTRYSASDEARQELGRRAQATFQANLGAAKNTAAVIVRSLATTAKQSMPEIKSEPAPVQAKASA